MGKFRQIWNGEHRSFVRYATFATAIFLFVIVFYAENNMLRWAKAGMDLRSQKAQMEKLREEISLRSKEIDDISHNVDSLEKFAREEFHFARQGDDVFLTDK